MQMSELIMGAMDTYASPLTPLQQYPINNRQHLESMTSGKKFQKIKTPSA